MMRLKPITMALLSLLLLKFADATSDSIAASDSVADSDPKTTAQAKDNGFPSLIKSETTIESNDSQSPSETIIDLGNQLCNTEVRVQWKIVNKTKQAIDWPRMTVSCGCITGVSNSISLPMTDSAEMELKIKLPRNTETLTKQVTFWDANGNGRCQATIKANVITPLKIEEPVLDVSDEKKHWKSISVTASNESIDLRKVRLAAYGAEITGFEFKAQDGQKGTLQLEIDPSQTFPPSIRSSYTFEVTEDGAFRGTSTVPMHFTARTIMQPEPTYFRLVGKEYQTKVRVWSFPLAAELSKKSEFMVLASSDAAKKLGTTFESTIEPPTGKGPTCTVTIKYAASKFGATNAPVQLRLKCGAWEQAISCNWD